MSPLRYLFIDMNSYFASCEQQANPALRGRPVAVTPMADVMTTCCIAASREAKKFGIKTGTPVWQARHLCPDIVLVPAKHERYIDIHEKIVKAVNTVLPVKEVKSIDELYCKLMGDECEEANAVAKAKAIKAAIRAKAGDYMTCSIGLGPSVMLAKLGTDLQKPDGLVSLPAEGLHERLKDLKLQDFCGIGPRMEKRFLRFGVRTVEQMLRLDAGHLCQIWGSKVHGWRWWYLLRGHDVPDKPTKRRTVGHSHILPPVKRGEEEARGVLMKLVHKAAARMRKIGYCTETVSISVHFFGERGGWGGAVHIPKCSDTPMLQEAAAYLWKHKPGGKLMQVAVTFLDLTPTRNVTPSLFEQDRKASRLSDAMDQANRSFGPNSVYLGSTFGHTRDAPMRISFTHIPDEETESANTLRTYGWK